MSGTLFILSAPSGAGKTSLAERLLAADRGVVRSVSHTTRAPRAGEVDGRDYHFVSAARFEQMTADGEFLEYATVHGNCYGTSQAWVASRLVEGRDVILVIDVQGAAQVRRLMPDTVGIFVLPPSLPALAERLTRRGDPPDVIAARVDAARGEIAHIAEFDYVIINEDLDCAAQDLTSIVRCQRLRLSRQLARRQDFINRFR
jgi:guanylate kinase